MIHIAGYTSHLKSWLFRILLTYVLVKHALILRGLCAAEHLGSFIPADVDCINECLVHTLQHADVRIDTHSLYFVDASQRDAVPRLGHVHKVVMSKQSHRVWSLSFRNSIWAFLQRHKHALDVMACFAVDTKRCQG